MAIQAGAYSKTITPTLTVGGFLRELAAFSKFASPTLTITARLPLQFASVPLYTVATLTISLRLTAKFPVTTFTIIPTFYTRGGTAKPLQIVTRYPRPPIQHPFRLIAQEVLTRKIVDWDLPVQDDFSFTRQLSGPTVMAGSFKPEIISVQELGLDGYAYFFHVEISGEIRATALLLPPKYSESSLEFQCEGISALPHYITWGGDYSAIGVDPLSIVRSIWNFVQSDPLSDFNVIVDNTVSDRKLGIPAHQETTTDSAGVSTTQDVEAQPYELQWWEAPNCGDQIDTLSNQTPFDYRERVNWNASKTDVELYLDLGYPRLGTPRDNLLFNEENIIEVVPVQESADIYASEVIVIGAGEGSATVRGYAAGQFGNRIRKVHVVTDKTITTQQRADAVAQSELDLRKGNLFTIDEVTIRAYHPNAYYGEYDLGDDILIEVYVPWLLNPYAAWYRITAINFAPSKDIVKLTLQRSDSYRYPVA